MNFCGSKGTCLGIGLALLTTSCLQVEGDSDAPPAHPDTSPPSIAITVPTSQASVATNAPTISLGGTADDDTALSRVSWRNDKGGDGAAAGTSAWTIGAIALQAGPNAITVTATDVAGNRATDQIVVTYEPESPPDLVPPSISISSPTDRSAFTSNSATIDLGGSASDNISVESVGWSNDRGGQGTASGTESWSVRGVQLANGSNRITVTATDAAGNLSSDLLTVNYVPGGDVTAPEVAISSPSDTGTHTTADDRVTVAGTASDDGSLAVVRWALNDGDFQDAVGVEDWSTPVLLLTAGENTVDVVAIDSAGNAAEARIVITLEIDVPEVLRGIAVIGDSNADEYRADDNRGGAYAATTLNWVEQLERYRGLNFGPWGSRGSPRRSGYKYNWALSGATASSMISGGQHTGVAGQVAAGEVSLVFIDIGYNDFAREKYQEIYDGRLSGSALDSKIGGIIDDITEAVDTVMAAGPVSLIVAGIYDYSANLPVFNAAFPDASRRQVVTDAIREINAELSVLADRHGAAYVDQSANTAAVFATANSDWMLDVGGELIDMINPGNEPHHARLNDASQHAGTVVNALYFANMNFIDVVNSAFGTTLPRFSDEEILRAAGID